MSFVCTNTSTKQHTAWDLAVTSSDTKLSEVHVGEMLSDHLLIQFKMNTNRDSTEYLWATCRSWKKMSHSSLKAVLKASRRYKNLDSLTEMYVYDLADLYDTTLLNLLNRHCRAMKIRRRFGHLTPWLDGKCCCSRRHSEMLVRRYRKSRSNADCMLRILQLKKMHRLYE